jgi:tyrosyl-tRNA synthetase
MSIDEQVAFLMQGTEYGDEEVKKNMTAELRQRLIEAEQEGRPLRVYCGYDPVKPDLHLGHTITMRKLRQFQDLGHQVIFLIGTYTSLIGDPSDKDVLRPILTPEQVEENARTYAEQAFRVLDRERTIVRHNAEWLAKLTFADLIKLASNFTVQQFLTRENFRLRWEKGDAVYLHETFYSIMQGYDAYALEADVQVGGTEQLFNIFVAARKIAAFLGAKPNIAVLTGILPGTDGVIRMSKSLGNHIPINTTPEDMYGKVMSIPDFAMGDYFRLITHLSNPEIETLEKSIKEGRAHPRDVKMRLARDVVAIYYSEAEAEAAQQAFVRVFQKGDLPEAMPAYRLQPGETVLDVLMAANLVSSKGEGRRLLSQNGVRLDGETLSDANGEFPHAGVLQVGKRRFLRVTA